MESRKRFWEIDFARGVAVVLMVFFNWSFTFKFLGVYAFGGGFFYWWLFPRLIGSAFIFLAGLSLSINYARNRKRKKTFSRGLKIFALGLGITAVTWFLYPTYAIFFGVLHLIGASLVISPIFLKFKSLIFPASIIFLIVGIYLQSTTFSFSGLFWLGFIPTNLQTFDYWPLMPFFGVFLLGMFIADFAYKTKNVRETQRPLVKQICFLGRKSLLVYLAHQPVLITILYFFGVRM